MNVMGEQYLLDHGSSDMCPIDEGNRAFHRPSEGPAFGIHLGLFSNPLIHLFRRVMSGADNDTAVPDSSSIDLLTDRSSLQQCLPRM